MSSTDIWHVTTIILLLLPAPMFFSTSICPLSLFCALFVTDVQIAWLQSPWMYFYDDVKFFTSKKVLRSNKIQELAGGFLDLPSSGL